jgi:GGDEF domain-containing protein
MLAEGGGLRNFRWSRRPRSGEALFGPLRADAALRRSAARVGDHSYRDPLTRLADPPLLERRLGQAVLRNEPTVAILFADIDPLPTVGGTHRLSDGLLRAVSGRLSKLIGPDDTMARLADNKILVLCEDLENMSAVKALAARIEVVLNGTFALEPSNLSVSSTVGILFAGAAEDLPAQILCDAETAIYRATCNGTLM